MSARTRLAATDAARMALAEGDPATIYCVEDDVDLRDILVWALTGGGYRPVACQSGAQAIETITPRHAGRVLLDLGLPDMDWLDLHRRLLAQECRQPFIVLTGSGDISQALQALRQGAVDFLQKPFNWDGLLLRVGQAVQQDRNRRRVQAKLDRLTLRERDILWLMVDGQATKQIAFRYAISPRTVDVHRHHILKKMVVESLVQLLRELTYVPNGGQPSQGPAGVSEAAG